MDSKQKTRLQYLANKWLKSSLDQDEQWEFDNWISDVNNDPILVPVDVAENRDSHKLALFNKIQAQIKQGEQKRKTARLWPRIAVAAAAVVLIVLGVYFFNYRNGEILKQVQDDVAVNDIAPGKNTATLTLSNGKVIKLSEAKTGLTIDANKLTYSDGTAILPANEDALVSLEGMTISTPRGGQYQVKLPDGTEVWLNAASSITYAVQHVPRPVRNVKLDGEAYFEVRKHNKYPFVVSSRGQQVEVLGTHFNINSYPDEMGTKTTLLEGSVKVSLLNKHNAESSVLDVVHLVPGQQSALYAGKLAVKEVSVENAVGWKNGLFMFNDESLEEVMRKLSRWYGVEISIKGEALAQQVVYGTISKFSNISKVLSMLEMAGDMHFELNNNKVTVSKK